MTPDVTVVPAGGRLLYELCHVALGQRIDRFAFAGRLRAPDELADWRMLPASGPTTLLLLDPVGDEWTAAADAARAAQPEAGVVAVTARPMYWMQRHWRQRPHGRARGRADALLSADRAGIRDLGDALLWAARRPGERSAFWLPEHPEHPHAFFGYGCAGTIAASVAGNEQLHRALVLHADGLSREQVGTELGVQAETVSKWFKRLRDQLGVEDDVALGAWATRFGLLDDRPRAG